MDLLDYFISEAMLPSTRECPAPQDLFQLTWSRMVTASITLLYLSYAVPVICLLIKGRNSIKHGPFWMGKIGLVSNIVLLAWTLFTFVMYSFPTYKPVIATSKSTRYKCAKTFTNPRRHELHFSSVWCSWGHHAH